VTMCARPYSKNVWFLHGTGLNMMDNRSDYERFNLLLLISTLMYGGMC